MGKESRRLFVTKLLLKSKKNVHEKCLPIYEKLINADKLFFIPQSLVMQKSVLVAVKFCIPPI